MLHLVDIILKPSLLYRFPLFLFFTVFFFVVVHIVIDKNDVACHEVHIFWSLLIISLLI